MGIALYDAPVALGPAEWVAVERVAKTHIVAWKRDKREGLGRDPRLSGFHAPAGSYDRLLMRQVLGQCSSTAMPSTGIFAGLSATREL